MHNDQVNAQHQLDRFSWHKVKIEIFTKKKEIKTMLQMIKYFYYCFIFAFSPHFSSRVQSIVLDEIQKVFSKKFESFLVLGVYYVHLHPSTHQRDFSVTQDPGQSEK